MGRKQEISVYWSETNGCWIAYYVGFATQGIGDTPAKAIEELQSITETFTDSKYRYYLTKDNEWLQQQNVALRSALAEIHKRTEVVARSGPMEFWHIHTISHDALKDNS